MSEAAAAAPNPGRELYARHALLEGHSVAMLRIVDVGDHCRVDADVWPAGAGDTPVPTGPYTFPSAVEATRFVTHAVEALMALGCDVRAQ